MNFRSTLLSLIFFASEDTHAGSLFFVILITRVELVLMTHQPSFVVDVVVDSQNKEINGECPCLNAIRISCV